MAMNTNGVQWSIQKKFHDAKDRLLYDTVALKRKVEASSNLNPQVVFAHHPMYTKGNSHGRMGDSLREQFGVEDSLQNGRVKLYLSGHEHINQYTRKAGILHVVVGAPMTNQITFYGGEDLQREMDWVDRTTAGFVVVEMWPDGSGTVKFIATADLSLRTEVRF